MVTEVMFDATTVAVCEALKNTLVLVTARSDNVLKHKTGATAHSNFFKFFFTIFKLILGAV